MLIREMRENLGMQPRDLAEHIGSTEASVYRWEREGFTVDEPSINRVFRRQMSRLAKKAEKHPA